MNPLPDPHCDPVFDLPFRTGKKILPQPVTQADFWAYTDEMSVFPGP